MTLNKHIIPAAVVALMALTTLPGCFTGVERTAVIKDTTPKTERKLTPEQTLLASALPKPPARWERGKAFVADGGKMELAYTPAGVANALQRGDTLRFYELKSVARLSGDTITELLLTTPGGSLLSHKIETAPSALLASDSPLALPFVVDVEMTDSVRALLKGRKVWTLTTARYNPDGTPSKGLKFAPVVISEVRSGTADYPIEVLFPEADGKTSMLRMVTDSKTPTARTFNNLFSLTDPRKKYPAITDEVWALICKGEVKLDMTREECRLALGSPATVDRETTYGGLMERWTYENGIYLIFTDGLLTRFRR